MNITSLDDIDLIINGSRKAISEYCISKCNAKCCKKGKLLLTKKLAEYVINNKNNIITFERPDNFVELDISKGCPSLSMDNRCLIHETSPLICKEFPIFLKHKTIILSEFCPGVNQPFFNEWIDILTKKGYKIIKQ
jgi:Fe-S-cluster containining protein